MATFGQAAKAQKPTNKSDNVNAKTMFMDTKRGIRIFRIVGAEVRVKQFWLARNPDNNWVPKFGYSASDKRIAIPVTISVFDPSRGEDGSWVGNAWDNPITRYLDTLELDEEERKKLYAKESVFIPVLDRTPVKTDGDVVAYPDPQMKYPEAMKAIVAKVSNAPKVLQLSSGKVRDENGDIVGKHGYANLLRVVESGEVDPVTGDLLSPYLYDIRVKTTGTGMETERAFSATANRDVLNVSHYYDVCNWQRPLQEEALDNLLNGAEWKDVVERYNVKMYPDLVAVSGNDGDERDGLPF
jgi:hypothetical protein